MAGRFGTVITAMVTPFREDSSLDVGRAQELARWLAEHGSDGLVVAGSTGEGATLTDDEKVQLWRAVAEAVEGRAAVIANSGTNDTRQSIRLTEAAERAGVTAILAVSPYYNKPPQTGMIEHFTLIARATSLPVLLYNVPGRTASRIANDTVLMLAEVDNIVGLKDSTGDLDGTAHLLAAAPSGFDVYSGDDWATFPLMCLGAAGIVSVASHVAGDAIKQMTELIESGDVPAARKAHLALLPLFDAMFITSNPIPVRAALDLIGQPVGPPRLPLVAATGEERARIRKALEDAGVL